MDNDKTFKFSLPNIPWPFPWPGKKDDDKDDDYEDGYDPLLFIPGIGGSILEAVSEDGKRERVWVRLLNADHEFRTKLWSKFNPATGKTVSLDPKSHIEVPDANFGLYACDILEPGLKLNLDMVNYYHNMIEEFHRLGFEDGKNLFGFGYDFRQSNRFSETMEALLHKLRTIHKTTGKKVNVITHSMGGLLFKSFLALHHEEVEAHVGKWISIAAPFRGAPGFIMDTLLTGVDFIEGWEKNLFVAKWSMHQLLVECPSVYELMAEYESDWEETPELRIVRAPTGEKEGDTEVTVETFKTPRDVLRLLQSVLKHNSVKIGSEEIKLPFSLDIVEWAVESRRLWQTAVLPPSVRFYNIFGHSNDTPHHTTYGTPDKPITENAEILHTTAIFENVDGDGTVPVESGRADNLNALFRVGVPGEHRALLRDPRVFRLVEYFLEVGEVDPMYDPYEDFVVVPSKKEVEEAMAEKAGGGEGEVGLPDVEQVGVGAVVSSSAVCVEVGGGEGDVGKAAEVAVAAGGVQ